MTTTTRARMNLLAANIAAAFGLTVERASATPFDGGVSITFDATGSNIDAAAAALRSLGATDVDAFACDGVASVSGTVTAAAVAKLAA